MTENEELTAFLEHHGVEGFLEHFGVKGMRWGQRKADSSSPLTRSYEGLNRKPTDSEIILARKEQAKRGMEFRRQVKASKKAGNKKTIFTEDILNKLLEDDYDPIPYAAAYKTTGEKRVAALLGGVVGAYLYSDLRATDRKFNTSAQDYIRKYGKK